MSTPKPPQEAEVFVRRIELSYVLVADANVQRTAACLESIRPFNVGLLIARDGDDAARILQRFGTPILFIADLSLPGKDALGLIESVRAADGGSTQIFAWSSFRELREFAAHRLAGSNVRLISGSASLAVVRRAIERALLTDKVTDAQPAAPDASPADDLSRAMSRLSEEARQLCGTSGAAVYVKLAGERAFRASVAWASDAPMPHVLDDMPRVLDQILATGRPVAWPHVSVRPPSGIVTSTARGLEGELYAVPIVSADEQIVGTICLFDEKPLTFGSAEAESLEALGRRFQLDASSGAPTTSAQAASRGPAPNVPPQEATGVALVLPPPAPLDRRHGELAIARVLARMRRAEPAPLSVIVFDVEARRPGNAAEPPGDRLAAAADILARALRGSDLAIHWSDEYLLTVLPGIPITEARRVGERARAAMQAGAGDHLSVGGAVAELVQGQTFDAVVARASGNLKLARERRPPTPFGP